MRVSGLRDTDELSATLFSNELSAYRFDAAERLTAPVLVIGGRHDFTIGIETLRELAARLPTAEGSTRTAVTSPSWKSRSGA